MRLVSSTDRRSFLALDLAERLQKMLDEAEKMTPKQLYEQGLREIKTPHGTLRYWEHKLFEEEE
jgi:hypothetical protein